MPSHLLIKNWALQPHEDTSIVSNPSASTVQSSVSVTLSVNSPIGQTPQRIFTVDNLKDANLLKDVPFGVSMMNNRI